MVQDFSHQQSHSGLSNSMSSIQDYWILDTEMMMILFDLARNMMVWNRYTYDFSCELCLFTCTLMSKFQVCQLRYPSTTILLSRLDIKGLLPAASRLFKKPVANRTLIVSPWQFLGEVIFSRGYLLGETPTFPGAEKYHPFPIGSLYGISTYIYQKI